MPIFEYEEPETKQVIELVRPFQDRDKPVVLTRKPVPARLGIVAGGTPEPTMSQKLKAGYYQLEQSEGSRFKSSFNKKTINKALA